MRAKKERLTCSKLIMAAVMGCFFVGVIVGTHVVLRDNSQLGEWLAYIGAVAAVAVGFYSWKAKAENVIKLSQSKLEKIKDIDIS